LSLAFVWEVGTFHRGCPSAEPGCTHALAEIYKFPRRSPPVGNRSFQRKHFVLGCTALPGCTAPLLRRVRLSELRWRWCRAERSCITLHSCSTVANATLALARAQHDSTVIRLLSPPLRKSIRPCLPADGCATRSNFVVDFARLNMRLGSAIPARQCHHDFSATSSAPTVRLDAFLCDPMVPNDSCPQTKGALQLLINWHNGRRNGTSRAHYHRQCLRCVRRACHLGSTATSYVRCVIAPFWSTCLKDPLETRTLFYLTSSLGLVLLAPQGLGSRTL
jgi:hypothetical protein